jgi:hypothetical protein
MLLAVSMAFGVLGDLLADLGCRQPLGHASTYAVV